MHTFSRKDRELQQLFTSSMGHWHVIYTSKGHFSQDCDKAFTHSVLYKTHLGVSSSRHVSVAEATTKEEQSTDGYSKGNKGEKEAKVLQERSMLERSRA